MAIRLRRNETFDSPFRLDKTYKSAFVSVIGDDNQVISIVFTTGKECDNKIEFELDGRNVSFCRSSTYIKSLSFFIKKTFRFLRSPRKYIPISGYLSAQMWCLWATYYLEWGFICCNKFWCSFNSTFFFA